MKMIPDGAPRRHVKLSGDLMCLCAQVHCLSPLVARWLVVILLESEVCEACAVQEDGGLLVQIQTNKASPL